MLDTTVADGFVDGGLELGLQELESLEAPGFWTGFKEGVALTAQIAGAAAASFVLT